MKELNEKDQEKVLGYLIDTITGLTFLVQMLWYQANRAVLKEDPDGPNGAITKIMEDLISLREFLAGDTEEETEFEIGRKFIVTGLSSTSLNEKDFDLKYHEKYVGQVGTCIRAERDIMLLEFRESSPESIGDRDWFHKNDLLIVVP